MRSPASWRSSMVRPIWRCTRRPRRPRLSPAAATPISSRAPHGHRHARAVRAAVKAALGHHRDARAVAPLTDAGFAGTGTATDAVCVASPTCIRAAGPISVSDLATATGLHDATVSQALRHLRVARIVTTERDGRIISYLPPTIRSEPFSARSSRNGTSPPPRQTPSNSRPSPPARWFPARPHSPLPSSPEFSSGVDRAGGCPAVTWQPKLAGLCC